jgi:transcriptional regulator with XRE-family HTH domain
MNNIAKRLHQVREHRHISQGQIAKAIGVSVGTVQNYEHARTHIPADRLEPADLLAPPEAPPPRYRRPRYAL